MKRSTSLFSSSLPCILNACSRYIHLSSPETSANVLWWPARPRRCFYLPCTDAVLVCSCFQSPSKRFARCRKACTFTILCQVGSMLLLITDCNSYITCHLNFSVNTPLNPVASCLSIISQQVAAWMALFQPWHLHQDISHLLRDLYCIVRLLLLFTFSQKFPL